MASARQCPSTGQFQLVTALRGGCHPPVLESKPVHVVVVVDEVGREASGLGSNM